MLMFLWSKTPIVVEVLRDDLVSIWIPIITVVATTLITILSVNYNTNKQIKNQNKQTYMPRLRLNDIKQMNFYESHGKYEYMTVAKKAFLNSNKNDSAHMIENYCTVKWNIILENIGYGTANDIKLYSLIDGSQLFGGQSIKSDINQKTKSTEEIAVKEQINLIISSSVSKNIIPDENDDDFLIFVCNYQDLNKNNYKIMIGIIIKSIDCNSINEPDVKITSFYFQEGTTEYNKYINKYNENYKEIIKKINSK